MTNRLAAQTSPYLLQHKDNPVDWYPWGPEAFARAKAEDKPVFLSIGYSTCHWCHVMAHESFEDSRVAEAVNRDFVPIKVDREERPDVDDVYMAAVQAMTGTGGWPLSLFLTPAGKPFYGGTYYPPEDRYGRPGFLSLLSAIARAWKDRREDLESSAGELLSHLEANAKGLSGPGAVGAEGLERAARSLAQEFDRVNGGFGSAPKFPPSMRLEFLLRYGRRTGESLGREMVETTLSAMSRGGIYDHLGGGFHRYSVDERWLVPHFEKMLYDNALLARIYLYAHRAYGNAEQGRVARETLDYLLREMTPSGGGFFSAQDADSEGREGAFYVWTPESLADAVGAKDAPLVAARFGVTEKGNFEQGETVLSVVRDVPGLAREFGQSEEQVASVLERARARMYEARSRRVPPATDEKLLTDWTSLAISAFALAGRLFHEPRYERAARDAADRILASRRASGELVHRDGRAGGAIPGFASDYANFVEALLDLYEATFEAAYFRAALELQRLLDERFGDPRGGYFLSAPEHDGLIVRPREILDGATPSSNSVSAMNLLRLATFTGDSKFRERAEGIFSAASGYLERAPTAVPRLLCALDYRSDAPREVVLSGVPGRDDFEILRDAVFSSSSLNRVLAHAGDSEPPPELSGLLASRRSEEGLARAYVCEGFACRRPTADPAELRAALDGS